MKTVLKLGSVVALLVVTFGVGWLVARLSVGQSVDPASLTDLERNFTARMENVTLVGEFTIDGREDIGGQPERYEIASIAKIGDDLWRFNARITFGSTDVTLPVTVPVFWVGDTPMISITDFEIPQLGTFDTRLIFHGDRYAGSWQHGEFGGLMYGTIER